MQDDKKNARKASNTGPNKNPKQSDNKDEEEDEGKGSRKSNTGKSRRAAGESGDFAMC